MKNTVMTIACIAICLVLGNANAGRHIWNVEQGYEVDALRVTMTSAESGRVVVRECERCKDIVLEIVAQTRLEKGNKQLPIGDVTRYRGQPGVVFRATDTDIVTRIRIY